MIYYLTTRRSFLDFLTDRERAFEVSLGHASDPVALQEALANGGDSESVMLVWQNEKSLADLFETFVIVLPDGAYTDFLAWSVTYVGGFRPLTSFFRVIRASDIERFEVFSDLKPWLPRAALDAFAATAAAEAAVQIGRRGTIRSLTVQNCAITFSFAASRGLYAGLHPAQLVDLAERWDGLRQMHGSNPPHLSASEALSFWLVATTAFLNENSVEPNDWMGVLTRVIRSAQHGESESTLRGGWGDFSEIKKAVETFADASNLSRERQIRVLDQSADAIARSESPKPLKEAALGLLIAKLGDGSMDYLGLAMDYASSFQCVPLWFAFFSGFQKGYDGLTSWNSLGRHLVRRAAVKRDIFEKSRICVSYDEVRLIAEGKASEQLLGSLGAIIDVELLPCVPVPMPNPARRLEEDPGRRSPPTDNSRALRLLREVVSLLDRSDRGEAGALQNNDLFKTQKPLTVSNKRPQKK